MDERVKRTDSVRVKLSPEMSDRVEKMASEFGMPSATFCAFAVGDFVRRSEQQQSLTRMAVLDASRRSGDVIDEAVLQRIIEGMAPHLPALMQPNLPLEHGEAVQAS